jgi:putative peptidoglycan binding protein
MRTVLVLTCCLSLASFAGAAQQQNDQNQQQYKKKGNAQSQQVVTPQTGGGNRKMYKAGAGAGPHYNQNLQQPSSVTRHNANANDIKIGNKSQFSQTGQTQTNAARNLNSSKSNKFKMNGQTGGQANMSGNAASTKLNKSKFQGNAFNASGGGGGGKYQKKHFNLQTNQVNTKYKTVNFNQNYHIAGAHNWHGAKYQAFVNYHPVWHDQWWWSQHHSHIVLVFGGWYYWNAGYWYPAWGYDPGAAYYYDGPIYASNPDEDPGQVVANVQSALQEQGYYQGEIDGVLGPQTRAALAEYQSAQGLEPTGAVDEPTLETLGMA